MFIWVRGTLPRLRMDQLMNFAWEFILPMALFNMVVAGLWRFMNPGAVRWLVCAFLIVVPMLVLSALLKRKKKLQLRTYSFAE